MQSQRAGSCGGRRFFFSRSGERVSLAAPLQDANFSNPTFRLRATTGGPGMGARLIVVSNRVAVPDPRRPPVAGGLAVAKGRPQSLCEIARHSAPPWPPIPCSRDSQRSRRPMIGVGGRQLPADQSSCGQLTGVPRCPFRPWPTSITIARTKSGARKRAQACPSATRASITSPPALAMIA